MKKLFLLGLPRTFIYLTIFAPAFAFGQSNLRNAIYVEAAGNGMRYSVNYEFTFNKRMSAKVGGGYAYDVLHIPATFSYRLLKDPHHIETSLGLTFSHHSEPYAPNHSDDTNEWFIVSFFGYRYDRIDKRLFYKVGFTPLYSLTYEEWGTKFSPYYGLGVGLKIF